MVADFSSVIQLFITSACEALKLSPACLSVPRSYTQSLKVRTVTPVSCIFWYYCFFQLFFKDVMKCQCPSRRHVKESDRRGCEMTCNSGLNWTWAQKSSTVPLMSKLLVTSWIQLILSFWSNSQQLKFLHTDSLPSSWFAWVLSCLLNFNPFILLPPAVSATWSWSCSFNPSVSVPAL